MLRDREALRRDWQRLPPDDHAALAAWHERLAVAQARYAARAANLPPIRIDENLPIAAHAEEIVRRLRSEQVLVLAGETGSGKSTQLPKLCLAVGRGIAGWIGCTQPRRVAARSLARRVAAELGGEVGGRVGCKVRFADQVGEQTLIKFMTDGILLAETAADRLLMAYDTIILDEAHERSLNVDFLLGYLKRLLARRRDLQLILTSATIDTARFARHFGNATVIEVAGRSHPVEVRWRPPEVNEEGAPRAAIVAAIDEITAEDPHGDVLVFLPGEREIRDTHAALAQRGYRATEILPLYARLSAKEQDRVFRPGPARRIVLATNVAETSLTVPRIRYVIDTGTARIKRYAPRNQLERLHIEPISQAAAEQRKGRCGRVGPGVCIRLYAEADYCARPAHSDPEILRASLAGVILRMYSLGLGDPLAFPFLDAPTPRALADGQRRLVELGALRRCAPNPPADRRAARYVLTRLGREMAALPIDVALARMLVEARTQGVVPELLILTSFLAIQDPRERPADARSAADAAHATFADARSDFIAILNLWYAYTRAHAELTQARLRTWCQERFLSYLRMREWRELHRQLLLQTQALNADNGSAGTEPSNPATPTPLSAARYEAVHRCLLSGWPTQVARRDERGEYRGTRERRFRIFPGSALANRPPPWLLAGQILDLKKIYGLLCARIEPLWIEQQAAHLVKRSWHDPHWSRHKGAVLAYERVTLHGLVLVERRVVPFAAQDPATAHRVFVREALVRGEIDSPADCLRANAQVLAEAHEWEAKRRESGLVRREEELAAFFAGKLPATISTTAAFDAWYRRATPAEQAALYWTLADVLVAEPGARAGDFPSTLVLGAHQLPLEYRFLSGDPADGVTLHLPLALLNAVPAARCEWLVPGLLAEKVTALIRGLPKVLRRNFVPAPDFARAFAKAEAPRDQPLAAALAAYLTRITGVPLTPGDFAGVALPEHLSMRFRVHDEHGRSIAEGRDLEAIRARLGEAARAAFAERAGVSRINQPLVGFDEDVPEAILGAGGWIAHPALVDLGESVALRVFESADEARAEHRRGVARLLRRQLHGAIKQTRRKLPIDPALALQYTAVASVDALREDLVEAALAEVFANHELDVRKAEEFRALLAATARALWPTALDWLRLVEPILAAYAELRPWLTPPLLGYARANYDDLREQLADLVYPGFVRKVDKARLAHYPRYLRAMRLRAMRLRQDPVRDQARLLTVRGFWREYLALKARRGGEDAALGELRWSIEELRVSLFAQELKTAEPVSPKRLSRRIEELRQAKPIARKE
jgi:ATP-dependent helicase HrpA